MAEDKHKSAQNESKFSALISLIKRESVEEIKEILHKWSNLLNVKDRSGRTALHYCSEHSSALCADFILEMSPSLLTAQDNDGYTALHLSVISGNQVMTRYLIGKSDTNFLNQCDNEKHTAIHWATVCGQVECLNLLLNSGAQSSRADIHGAYPLHYSAQMCNPYSGICIEDDPRVGLAVLNKLLECPDVDVDCVDSDGRTPLLWAASAGSADSILALINAGANVAAKDKDGLTALHCASSRGHIDCVETLLTLCGADVNSMDSNGCPPLFYAVTLGHADCTRLLIESGADVNAQDFKGRTAAHCGAARGQFETIKILGQLGANLWLRNTRGDLPLHEAVKSGRKELVKWLLDQIPAAVNATNSFGRSALHIAAINNNIEMCKILIDIGADVNTVMKTKGHFITPLDAALQKGYRGVAKYLLLHGALPASRISLSLNKTSVQRVPSGRPIDSSTAFENISPPIESYEEWKARSQSTDSALHSQTQFNPLDNSRTQLPKLPSLVKNTTDEQHILENSSSTSSSLLENTNHYKNVREFETPLNDKTSNLKQAIITNVYVTNTPICHSKRVPPLKKLKKRRKTLVEGEDKSLRVYTPSMSSSSSIINGEENIKVVMETKDDSSFKLNDSFDRKVNSDEELELKTNGESLEQKPIETKSEELALNVTHEDNQEIAEEEVTKQQISSVGENGVLPTLEHKDLITSERRNSEENTLKTKKSESKDSDSKSVKSIDTKRKDTSSKSVKSSALSDKSRTSEKSTQESSRTKRSVSQRRSSVVDTNSAKPTEKRVDSKQKTDNKKVSDSEKKDQKTDKTSGTSRKSSTRMSATKGSEESDENLKKQSKVKARKEFSDKLNKLSKHSKESNKSDLKSEEKSDLSANERDGKKVSEKDKESDDNRDIDSITYIKSDNESVKSNISSGNEKIVAKSEDSLHNEDELKKHKSEETKPEEVPFDKNQLKDSTEDKGEYDEYFDQWESDSEKTVIDSNADQKSTEDINNNRVDGSDRQMSKESNEIIGESDDKSDEIILNKTEEKSIEKLGEIPDETPESENKHGDFSDDKISVKSENKSEENKTKITSGAKTQSSNGKTTRKVSDKRSVNSRTNSKTSDKSKVSSGESSKSGVNKSVKTKDNKIPEKKKLSSDQNARQTDRRPSISRDKTKLGTNGTNPSKSYARRPSIAINTPPKIEDKSEPVIKSSDSLEKSKYLSASDMSLNKPFEDQIVRQSSALKNSISNQEINEYHKEDNEDRAVTNVSSEESIFDSSLVMADMERNDSQMYSDIDRLCPKDKPSGSSPLPHSHRSGLSPNREFDSCDEFCKSGHKPESRCCHKLHFKTMPAHLGKIETSHIGSRVDSRRDNRYSENLNLSRDRVRRVRRVRPTSDGYKSVDPNVITQTVEKSLRKYQLERKLFEELHELKRFQIRSGKSNEILMVKRMVDKFRREVKAPGMTDFTGSYTYKNFEFYLYDQLRRLSTSNEGKVALLTRSISNENIAIIRLSNESITQSSPELMQNSEGLDTNQQNKTHEIENITHNQTHCSSESIINEKQSANETINKEEVIEVITKTHHSLSQSQSEGSDKTDGNLRDNDNLKHFDNEFEVTDSEPKVLDPIVTELTPNTTHYQNSELKISENFSNTEEVSHIVIDSKEQPIHSSDSVLSESQINSTKVSEREEQNSVLSQSQSAEQEEGSVVEQQNQLLVQKIEEISEIKVNSILNEALNEQKRKYSLKDSKIETQIKTQKEVQKRNSFESNESRVTDQISDAKSTYGSTQSAKFESRSSSVSRRRSTKSMTNTSSRRRQKERQSFKKECLKPVTDISPSERAKNRKQFKRLKTSIPPKLMINISSEEIRNRWKDIKETEMKKVLILSSHKQSELISGYTLWYELNKQFRGKHKSIDDQIDRYIIENRSGLQRTHSDSYLHKYKSNVESNDITLDKSIK